MSEIIRPRIIKQWGEVERAVHAAVRHAKANHPNKQQELDALALEAQFKAAKAHGFRDRESHFSMERPIEKRIFSHDAKEALQGRGFLIYSPWGDSIQYLTNKGWKPLLVQSSWFYGEDFEYTPALRCEMAFDPGNLILKDSENKTLDEQIEMVDEYSIKLDIPGAKVIIGEAVDYASLVQMHNEYENKLLLKDGEKTRTSTRIYDSYRVYLGDNVLLRGISISYNLPSWINEDVGIWPLIVPANN